MDRREFIKNIAAIGSIALLNPMSAIARRAISASFYLGLHQFIESHPEAVFIKHTNVPVKTDSEAKQQEGLALAREIFILQDTPGIPLSNLLTIKPNLTCASGTSGTASGMGIVTDCDFVEGLIEGIKELGILADNMYIREGNWFADRCPSEYSTSPYVSMSERMGIHLLDFPTGRTITQLTFDTLETGTEVTWLDCPDGVVFRRIGYVAPFNQPNTWLINISKFKTHGMGMTLCTKNLQGMCVPPLVKFCEGVDNTKKYPQDIFNNFQPDFEENVQQLYLQHLAAGIPRWDRPGRDWNSGYGMEMWAQRTCDSISVTDIGLNIIEGIYGRNGNGFLDGPGQNGEAQDFMTNIIIFGKNPLLVDIIGHWLGGHEPGNFGLFHIAKERGLCNTINPKKITLYHWKDSIPKPISLSYFQQTPLLTTYLRQDYNGREEPLYHLVNEYYCYEDDITIEIPLQEGWNLFSIPLKLLDNSINSVLDSITGHFECLQIYDAGKWKRYVIGDKEFLNGLDELEPGKSYWIRMIDSAVLTLTGVELDDKTVSIRQGWNMIGYNCLTVKPVEEALSCMNVNCDSVWTYDALTKAWKTYMANLPKSNDSLEFMEPGRGYYVYLK